MSKRDPMIEAMTLLYATFGASCGIGLLAFVLINGSLAARAEVACVEHVTIFATEPCRCLPLDAYPEDSPLRGLPECETGGAE